MKIEMVVRDAVVVIGKEGSTRDGQGFIQKLWAEANSRFDEVEHWVKRDACGNPVGIWGAMSDFSRSFLPWENNFSEGLYLAGVECEDHAQAPNGWTKWVIPGYEYICAEVESNDTFTQVINYMREKDIPLVGAVHDFTCPHTGKNYMLFPVRRL